MSAILERTSRGVRLIPALVLCVLGPACIDANTADDNASNTSVVIVSMQAAEGEETTATGSDLFSDVCLNPDDIQDFCSVINDNGIVEMQAFRKDQGSLASFENNVVFERYRVTYIRADGRNVPGVDVPYAFDGVANFVVPVDSASVVRPFVVVRQQAKLEPPLRQLGAGGALILSVIAQIDFYGHDVAGRAVQVTGYLNISFANFADEQT
jgi:hypothetical protein